MQSKRNKFNLLWVIVKWLIALGALALIYTKVFKPEENRDYLNNLSLLFSSGEARVLLICVFLLMFLNWLIETIKWRFMIRQIENISLVKAYEAVLSGITVSFFTPNRIGEYAGRVFYLRQGNRLAAAIITIIENAGQLIITIITGCLAMIWYKNEFLEFSGWQSTAITWACLTVPVLVLFVFLNLNFLIAALSQNTFIKKYTHVFDSFSFYSKMKLIKLLLLSLLRYSVFSVQFFLLIKLFGLELPVLPTLFLISLSFFFMTIIPTIAITELGVRGAVSVYFISKINPDGVPVLNASFALWLINLVIPSVIGAFLILNVRWKKKSEWK